MVEPRCSNFRIITAIFRVSEYLGVLRYPTMSHRCFPTSLGVLKPRPMLLVYRRFFLPLADKRVDFLFKNTFGCFWYDFSV